MIYWSFFIEIYVKPYSVILFIREKCNQLPKNIYLQKKYVNKYFTFTHGSYRGGMATCIIICLKTVFVNNYRYLKQSMWCFSIYKSLVG